MRSKARAWLVAVAAVAALLGVGGLLLPASTATAAPARPNGPVVVVGVAGLRWADLNPTTTPTLWRLASEAGVGSVSVRTVASATCPGDGWLTFGAGQRAAQQAVPDRQARERGEPVCPALPRPAPAAGGASVPGWATIRAYNASLDYGAQLGLLGDALAAAGRCATAVGPGAALALARSDGVVGRYADVVDSQTVRACPLTVVDAGGIDTFEPSPQPEDRSAQAAAVDRAVARAVAAVPADATLLVVGLADSTRVPHLEIGLARGPDATGRSYDGRWLATNSTRRVALVQLTDVTTTVLDLLRVPEPASAVGSAWTAGPRRDTGATAATVDRLVDADTVAQVVRRMAPTFFTLLVGSQLLLYGIAAVALRRQWGGPTRRRKVLVALRRTALVFAAVPLASFLVNLVPWWRGGHPLPALLGALAVAVAAITLLAELGPWRHRLIGPPAVVGGLTALVLAGDIATGSRLQLSSLMGYSPLVAGRFFGFGNVPYAVFATGALLAVTAVADLLIRRGSRRAAVLVVVAAGVLAVAVDGWPRWGSDFGGVLALVPGFAVLAMLVAGIRVSPARFGLALLGAVASISAIAVIDYTRPPEQRTHLGRFVAQVIDGEAWTVIRRKAAANLGTLTNYQLALLVPIAFVFVALVLMRPLDWRAAALDRAYARTPQLRNGVAAILVTLVIAFAVNDSGIAIPAVALTIAIPLILAASVKALELDEAEQVAAPGPPAPRAPARP